MRWDEMGWDDYVSAERRTKNRIGLQSTGEVRLNTREEEAYDVNS